MEADFCRFDINFYYRQHGAKVGDQDHRTRKSRTHASPPQSVKVGTKDPKV